MWIPWRPASIRRCFSRASSRPCRPGRSGRGPCIAIERRAVAPRAATALKGFRDLIAGLAKDAMGASVADLMSTMLDRSGYLQDLREERSEEAEARIENLQELVSAAREYELREVDPSLGGFVDRLSLLSEADEADGTKEASVWLMSMHAAKGLEFPVVIIAGLEEGLFPHARSVEDEDDVEEERRLFYVGLTRARERLVLTGAARRRVFGEYQATEVSRFMDEIPATLDAAGRAGRPDAAVVADALRAAESVRAARRRAAIHRGAVLSRRRPRRDADLCLRERGPVAFRPPQRHARAPQAVRPRHGHRRRGPG